MTNPLRSLSARLLLFNILILFLPLGSLLLLDTYENQLLASQENSMIQQGRLLSSALSGLAEPEAEVQAAAETTDALSAEALRILENLKARVDSRLRVVDRQGRLLADSARLFPPETVEVQEQDPYRTAKARLSSVDASDNFLYRAAVYPINLIKKMFFPPQANYSGAEYYSGSQVLMGPEIEAALEGRYGAATRLSTGGQVSVTLYSAIPIEGKNPGDISGAVLVSRSSFGILLNLYRLRLDIIKIFFFSIVISLALSLGLSLTITFPIKKLKNEAERVLDKSGRFREHFRGLKRKDEIGDLSRSLSRLSQKLEKRIAFIDAFTSDLLHELKNPMAAIRAQTELAIAAAAKEPKLLEGIRQEEGRMERLLARLRELSRIDNTLEREETVTVNLGEFLPAFAENRSLRDTGGLRIVYETAQQGENTAGSPTQALVRVNTDRLMQALSNPLDNAVSFSPPGGTIRLRLYRAESGNSAVFRHEWRITIDDDGPGIREGSAERCFDRFYSERAESEKENHSGLGLAIVKAIAEGYGGNCKLENRLNNEGVATGCRFTLMLPEAE
ncbi:histidine kinase [Spirochaetia bacterium]|nr:histidine kinase [Spirochaetia bacterium]